MKAFLYLISMLFGIAFLVGAFSFIPTISWLSGLETITTDIYLYLILKVAIVAVLLFITGSLKRRIKR